MKVYKLTDSSARTNNIMQWGEGVTNKVRIRGNTLCSNQVIHYYSHPYIAILMNPIHANHIDPLLWEADTPKSYAYDGTKGGCKTLTTLRQIPIPQFTSEQLITIAIKCALAVYHEKSFVVWANKWLEGTDRIRSAAIAARIATRAATRAGEYVAWAAVRAAEAAAIAARTSVRIETRTAAARSAAIAVRIATEAAEAVAIMASRTRDINLISILNEVLNEYKEGTNGKSE